MAQGHASASLQVFLWSGTGDPRDGKTYYSAFTLNGAWGRGVVD